MKRAAPGSSHSGNAMRLAVTSRVGARRILVFACALAIAAHARPARADNLGDLVTQLGDDSDKVRLSAATALARLGKESHDTRAIMAMAKCVVNDSEKSVRGACAYGLGVTIDDTTKPSIKKLAVANLKKALAEDDSDFVKKQAEKALDLLGAGGGATSPKDNGNSATAPASAAGGIYVNIGPMSSKTGGTDDKKLQAQMVTVATAAMASAAPSYATTWPGGVPSKGALAAKQIAGFYVDGTLNELKIKEDGSTATVSCKISMLLASFPDKSVFGFLNGGASVQASTSPRDEALARGDCVQAVVEDLIRKKIVPTIKSKVP